MASFPLGVMSERTGGARSRLVERRLARTGGVDASHGRPLGAPGTLRIDKVASAATGVPMGRPFQGASAVRRERDGAEKRAAAVPAKRAPSPAIWQCPLTGGDIVDYLARTLRPFGGSHSFAAAMKGLSASWSLFSESGPSSIW